jgi:Adenylylsulphate kinase
LPATNGLANTQSPRVFEVRLALPIQEHFDQCRIERHSCIGVFGFDIAYYARDDASPHEKCKASQSTSHHLRAKSSLQRSPVARSRITIVRIAPYDAVRKAVRDMIAPVGGFILVYVATPLDVCEQRDRKGLYAKARAGVLPHFTGISDPYEPPSDAEVVTDTTVLSPREIVRQIVKYLELKGYLRRSKSAANPDVLIALYITAVVLRIYIKSWLILFHTAGGFAPHRLVNLTFGLVGTYKERTGAIRGQLNP